MLAIARTNCFGDATHAASPSEWLSLKSMRFSIEIGSTQTLFGHIRLLGADLVNSRSQAVRREYAAILREAETLSDIERIHGKGSALNLSHPTNIAYMGRRYRDGRPMLPAQWIENAKRYRSLTSPVSL